MSKTEDYLDGLLDSMEGRTRTVEPEEHEPMAEASAEEIAADEAGMQAETEYAAEEVQMDAVPVELSEEDDFLDAFEQELLSGEDSDEFIRQFEAELEAEEVVGEPTADGLHTVSEQDEIGAGLDGGIETGLDGTAAAGADDDMDVMVDTLGDAFDEAFADPMIDNIGMEADDLPEEPMVDTIGDLHAEEPMAAGLFETPSMDMEDEGMAERDEAVMNTEKSAGLMDDDQDLMSLLQSEGDFSDIGDMLKADESDMGLIDDGADDAFADFSFDEAEALAQEQEEPEEPQKKRRKKDKKQDKETAGFIQKISQALFGEDEEESVTEEPVKLAAAPAAPSIEELSDENLQILQALEGGGASTEEPAAELEEDPKQTKKRQKQEKKEKAKAERAAKKEAAKKAKAEKAAKKPKKVKKPKEPDNTPPLPRKPVILTFVMAASFLALIIIGTNLFGYSNSMDKAEREFGLGNYELAYKEVSGMELKEQDVETYEKYRIMANVSGEYSAYQSFMETELYDMALDALIRTAGRCQKYQQEAEVYGCTQELARVKEQAAGALASFGITEERALELYAIDERETYSAEIYTVLMTAGFGID